MRAWTVSFPLSCSCSPYQLSNGIDSCTHLHMDPKLHSVTQGASDAAGGAADAVVIPPASAGQAAVVDAAVASVRAQMAVDRKTTALKSLQVLTSASHLWHFLSSLCMYGKEKSSIWDFFRFPFPPELGIVI